jgi:hypothetical protein
MYVLYCTFAELLRLYMALLYQNLVYYSLIPLKGILCRTYCIDLILRVLSTRKYVGMISIE